jgi:hypothetical protein
MRIGPAGLTFPDGTTQVSAGSSTYDQSLNTGDSVQFANLQVDTNLSFKASGDNTDTIYITKENTAGNISVLQIFVGDDGGPANVNSYYPDSGSGRD